MRIRRSGRWGTLLFRARRELPAASSHAVAARDGAGRHPL